MPSEFPSILLQRELAAAASAASGRRLKFKRVHMSADRITKYFKGEKWGTGEVWAAASRSRAVPSARAALRNAKRTLKMVDTGVGMDEGKVINVGRLILLMEKGPPWAQLALEVYLKHVRDDLRGGLESLVSLLERAEKHER